MNHSDRIQDRLPVAPAPVREQADEVAPQQVRQVTLRMITPPDIFLVSQVIWIFAMFIRPSFSQNSPQASNGAVLGA